MNAARPDRLRIVHISTLSYTVGTRIGASTPLGHDENTPCNLVMWVEE